MRTVQQAMLAVILAASLISPGLAAQGSSGNGNNGNGSGGSSADSAKGDASDNGNAGGNGKPDGRGLSAGEEIVSVPNDQAVARDAVRSKSALSLEVVSAIVKGDTSGRILDVQLVTINGTYVFDVTVLEANGVLHKLYYYARSGAPFGIN